MNICVIHGDNIFTCNRPDCTRVREMIKAMLNQGHKVSLILCDLPHRKKLETFHGVKVYFFGVKLEIMILAMISRRLLNFPLFDLLRARLGLTRRLKQRLLQIIQKDEIDIIQCENFLTAVPVSRVVNRFPIIVTAHDVMTENFVEKTLIYGTPKLLVNFALHYYEKTQRQGLQSCDICVCMTQHDMNQFGSMGISKEKLFVIPQGAYISKITPSPKNPELFKILGLEGSNPVLFFCGSDAFNNNKAAENIIKVILPKILIPFPSTKVLFAGGVCNYIQKSGLHSQNHENIILVGYVEDIAQYYSLYDIYLLPITHATGCQTKVADALAVGKPIICTSKAAAGYEVTNGNELIIEDCIENYHLHIIDMLQNPQKAKILGENARRASLRYDWATLMDKYNEIYELFKTKRLRANSIGALSGNKGS